MAGAGDHLRRLIPAATRLHLGDSLATPIELGALLAAAAGTRRTLLCFAPPLTALGAASAGVLRAAREAGASVVLRVDLDGRPGQAFQAAIGAIGLACDQASYRLPLGLVGEIAVTAAGLHSGAVGLAVGEAIAAGFPAVIVRVAAPVDPQELIEALAPARDRELGCAVAFAELGPEPEAFLHDLCEGGAPLVAVGGDVDLALAGRGFRWARGDVFERDQLLAERPPVLEFDLGLRETARGERAEAAAYFAAETAFAAWEAEQSGPAVARALLHRWR